MMSSEPKKFVPEDLFPPEEEKEEPLTQYEGQLLRHIGVLVAELATANDLLQEALARSDELSDELARMKTW